MSRSGKPKRVPAHPSPPEPSRTPAHAGRPRENPGWFHAKRPVLRTLFIFSLLMGAFYAFEFTGAAQGSARHTYLAGIARASGTILRMLGHDATVDDVTIRSPGFSVEIVRGCDASDSMAVFVAAVLATPLRFGSKIPGIAVGTLAILTINLVRVVSLFLVGIHFPAAFEIMHREVWQATFIVLAIVAWAIWVQWSLRRGVRQADGGG